MLSFKPVFPLFSVTLIKRLFSFSSLSSLRLVSSVYLRLLFLLGLTGLILQTKELSSLLQHHSSKESVLQHLFFFMVQLSHPYMTTEKNIALMIQTFINKVMSLLSNRLFRFVIAFLLRSKHLLISWLQSLFTVISEPEKNKICHCLHFLPIYLL